MHGLCPGSLKSCAFLRIKDLRAEELLHIRNHGYESQQITQRNEWRREAIVCLVLLPGSVSQADFFLVVEPVPVVWTGRHIDDPSDKTEFHSSLVVLVRLPIRANKPAREMGLCCNDGAPRVDHLLCQDVKQLRILAQSLFILAGPPYGLFKLRQVLQRNRRLCAG